MQLLHDPLYTLLPEFPGFWHIKSRGFYSSAVSRHPRLGCCGLVLQPTAPIHPAQRKNESPIILNSGMYVCTYVYACVCIYIYIYGHVHADIERVRPEIIFGITKSFDACSSMKGNGLPREVGKTAACFARHGLLLADVCSYAGAFPSHRFHTKFWTTSRSRVVTTRP